MPRTGKGGKQQGASQTAYSNRSDLNNRGPEPITVAPGEPYGQRQMLEDAQRAVPVAGVQTPAPAPGAPQAATQAPQGAPAAQVPPTLPKPGELSLFEPGNHNEPTTAGALLGSGPGPEALNLHGASPQKIADILESAASSPHASTQVQELAAFARQIGV